MTSQWRKLHRMRILAVGLLCAGILTACSNRPQPNERAALEKQLDIAVAGAHRDGSPAFYHDAEKDAKRLLLLDRDEKYFEKTVAHLKVLSEVCEKTGHHEEAKHFADELRNWDEWNTERSLGQEDSAEQQYGEAEVHLRKGIAAAEKLDKDIFGKYLKALMVDYQDLAFALEKQGRPAEADPLHAKVLAATIAEEGSKSEAVQAVRLNTAQFYADTKRSDQAMTEVNAVIKEFPHNLEARQKRAQLNSIKGDHHAAVADLDVALTENPEAWPLYLLRARENNLIGQPRKAIADADIAFAQKPLALAARAHRAQAYLTLNQKKEARAELDAILRESPHDAWANARRKEFADTAK